MYAAFLAGEVSCLFRSGRLSFGKRARLLFWQLFFRIVVILRACVRVDVAEFLWSVTVLTTGRSPHTSDTFTPWWCCLPPPPAMVSLAGVVTRNRALISSHRSKTGPVGWPLYFSEAPMRLTTTPLHMFCVKLRIPSHDKARTMFTILVMYSQVRKISWDWLASTLKDVAVISKV